MALGTREHATYLRFQAGQVLWSRGSEKGLEGYVEGVITGVRFEDRDFEKGGRKFKKRNVVLSIRDGGESYVLTDAVDSSSGMQLQNKLLNTNVGDRVRISPGKRYDVKDGSPVVLTSGVFVDVGSKKISQKYNKENPGICPQWKQRRDGSWDRDEQLAFLEAEMIKHFENAAAVEHASQHGEFHESEIPRWEESPSDDTPPF